MVPESPTPKEPAARKPGYPISSVDNALRLLRMFKDVQRLRVSDAAAALGVSVSTAHRLLAMLQLHGFVRQEQGTRSYMPGTALMDIGFAVVRKLDIRETVRPILEELAGTLGETVHFAQLEGANVRYLISAEGVNALRVADRSGKTVPSYSSATGRAMLAHLTPSELDHTLNELGDEVDLIKLGHELEATRERGYAVNFGNDDGIGSFATTVRDPDGRVRGAISVSGPVPRMRSHDRVNLVRLLLNAASRLEEQLAR